jgi:hypothetical protein
MLVEEVVTACRGIDGEDGMYLPGDPIPNLDIPPTLPGLDPNPGDECGRNIPKVDGDRTNPGVVGGRKSPGVVLPLIPAVPAPTGRREEGVAIGILETMGMGDTICFGGVISIELRDLMPCRSDRGGDTSGVVDCFPPETHRLGYAGRSSVAVAVADALSCFLGGVGGRATIGADESVGDSSSSSSTYMRWRSAGVGCGCGASSAPAAPNPPRLGVAKARPGKVDCNCDCWEGTRPGVIGAGGPCRCGVEGRGARRCGVAGYRAPVELPPVVPSRRTTFLGFSSGDGAFLLPR